MHVSPAQSYCPDSEMGGPLRGGNARAYSDPATRSQDRARFCVRAMRNRYTFMQNGFQAELGPTPLTAASTSTVRNRRCVAITAENRLSWLCFYMEPRA